MSIHPRLPCGEYVKDLIDKRAYDREIKLFQILERALGKLHLQGNHTRYKIKQRLFGWESDASIPMKVRFRSFSDNGYLENVAVYIFCNVDESHSNMHEEFINYLDKLILPFPSKVNVKICHA